MLKSIRVVEVLCDVLLLVLEVDILEDVELVEIEVLLEVELVEMEVLVD